MELVWDLANIIIAVLILIAFLAATSLPLIAAWSLLTGRRVNWDDFAFIAMVLIVIPTLTASYGFWFLSSVNEAFDKSKPEMNQLFLNVRSLLEEDWLQNDIPPIPEPIPTAVFIVEDSITPQPINTPRPMILPTRTAVPQPTIFVCQLASDIILGCLPPTPEVMK